jgi:prepilin-type N-terminal cleavage/methylation domain-containing protein
MTSRTRRHGAWRALRGERGTSLIELLAALTIGSIVLVGTTSIVFSTNQIQARAGDRSKLAGQLAVVSLAFDRDTAMAISTATAKAQTTSTSCTTVMNLGWLEGGAAVRYQLVTSATNGPNWLQRISGTGTRTLIRYVSACTWQAVADSGGRLALVLNLTLTGPSTGSTMSGALRGAPRLW